MTISGHAARDAQWVTHTCPVAWESIGAWGRWGVAAVCRDSGLLSAADDSGAIKIFNYPAIEQVHLSMSALARAHATKIFLTICVYW